MSEGERESEHWWVLYRRVSTSPEIAAAHRKELFICPLLDWPQRSGMGVEDSFTRELLMQSTDRKALVKMKELSEGEQP